MRPHPEAQPKPSISMNLSMNSSSVIATSGCNTVLIAARALPDKLKQVNFPHQA
jgi:hypothetical protein